MKRWPAFSQRHLGSLEQAQKLSSCSSRTVGPFLPAREENADVHYTSPVEQPDGDPYIARAPFALVFMATCSLHQDPHLKSASATQDDGRTQASPPSLGTTCQGRKCAIQFRTQSVTVAIMLTGLKSYLL